MDPAKYRISLLRLVRIRQIQALILHYDHVSNGLRPWLWYVKFQEQEVEESADKLASDSNRPVQSGVRVPPSDLTEHRATHWFKGPCCLCAYGSVTYTECAIDQAIGGKYSGEYVAFCALERCGYIGTMSEILVLKVAT
jgi:hypothetical protein